LNVFTPVILPPGLLRLATRPNLTGSSPDTKTIGIVLSLPWPHARRGRLGEIKSQSWGRDRELSVLRSAARGQHECGAARPRCTEARACQTRGRGHAGASAASAIKERLSLTLSAEPAYADTVFNLARRCFGCCIRVLPCIAKRHNDLRSDHDSNSRTHKQNDPDSDVMQVARAFMPIAPSGPSSHDPCRCPHIQKNGPGIDHRNNHEGHAAETQAMCAPDITSRRKQRPCDSQAVS
jgi:hypothetical protein